MDFVCPLCKGELQGDGVTRYTCGACQRIYPVVCEIPDFRIAPDPYIGIQEDLQKGRQLAEAARTRSFAQMVDYYYSITPEDPPDLAAGWAAHALAAPKIAASILGTKTGKTLLDVGCATGGMLVAASRTFPSVTGVDVAFRWLVVAQVRLREAGVNAALVCANAEALPFRDNAADWITCTDVVEHLRDLSSAAAEFRRTAERLLCVTNNRYAWVLDPQVGLFGVGYLPRKWQPGYVTWRRADLHRYNVTMRSATELNAVLRRAGYSNLKVSAAKLYAPHRPALASVLNAYNKLAPMFDPLLRRISPKLEVIAES